MTIVDLKDFLERNDKEPEDIRAVVAKGMATKLREYAAAIGVDDSRCVSQAELIAETVVRMLRRPPALQTAEILEEVAKAVEHCATEFINVAPYLCLPLEIPQRR